MVPSKIPSSELNGRVNRGLFDNLGKRFKFVASVATLEDVISLKGLARNTEGVSRTVEWTKYYLAKLTHSIHHGNRIISNLNILIEGLQWLDQSVISPIIVPTLVLEEDMTFIQDHLEHNATTPVMLIPSLVVELHNFMSFYLARLNNQLLVALSIPLTSYSEAFVVYEVTVLPIGIPNSDLNSILEPEHRFVAIHDSTGHYVELTMEQVRGVQGSLYYLIQDVLVRTDADRSCILAIYRNMPKQVKQLCKYLVKPRFTLPLVHGMSEHVFYLRNVERYSVYCQFTVHHDILVATSWKIELECKSECSVSLLGFNSSGMIDGMGAQSGYESLTCKLITDIMEVPFTLPVTHKSQQGRSLSKYHTNLQVVIQSYYGDTNLQGLHGSSDFLEPPDIQVPWHKIVYHDIMMN